MIDKITPRPFEEVQRLLERDGIEGIKPFETEKHTFAAVSYTHLDVYKRQPGHGAG